MSIRKVERETLDKFKPGWKKNPRTGVWYTFEVDYYDPEAGVRRRRRGFHSEAEAQQFLHDQNVSAEMKRLGLVKSERRLPEVRELFEKRIAEKMTRHERARTVRVLRTFLGMLPEGMTLDQLRLKHFRDFVEKRIGEDVKPETANREMEVLSSTLSRAAHWFTELEDWIPPKRYYAPKSRRGGRERVVSSDEETRLFEYLVRERSQSEKPREYVARVRLGLIFKFGLLTGLRHGEICAIRKDQVQGDELRVWRPKTKIWTTFPLTPDMRDVIAAAEHLTDGEHLFSSRGVIHNGTYRTMRAACEELGIEYGRSRENGLVLHSTRHTFVTRLIAGGTDIPTVKSFSGHTSNDVLMRYAHATPAARKRAMEVISQKSGLDDKELEAIWKKVKAGKMSLKTFLQKVSKN